MRRTITWVLYSLMGVQILFGCAYAAANFGVEQQFRENMASSLPMGAVFLIQFMAAAVSVWYVLGELFPQSNKRVRGYVCAFLLTVPFLLHIHMAKLPWSAACSAFLWLLGMLLETSRKGLSKRRAAYLLFVWFFYGVICPDGLWLGGILLFAASFFFRKKGDKIVRFRLALLLGAGMIYAANMGLNRAFPQDRTIYRENTLGIAAISRFVWPNFGKNYFFWRGEVKDVMPLDDAILFSNRVDSMVEEFYPRLVDTYGEKKATKLCLEMARRCFGDRTKETLREIGRDLKDYFLLPFTIEKNLKGEGVSLTAWNYGRMREHTPILVKYYYRYGLFELPFLLLGSLLLWGFKRGNGEKQWKFLVFTWAVYSIWYAMRSNFPVDYKMALPILFLWYLAAVSGVLHGKSETEGGGSGERQNVWFRKKHGEEV